MAMLYLRNKPIGAVSGGSSGGGHTIENPSGTDMTQRSVLQFTDADVADDSTNDRTEISIVRELMQAEFDELTPEEQNRGVIVIKDANPSYLPSDNAVSVTADGVKTYRQLFNELYALIDATKVTRNAKLIMTNTSGDVIYDIERIYGNAVTFVKTRNIASDYLVETIWFGTNSAYYLAATEASSTTFTDSTNSVPASGVTFTLYYNILPSVEVDGDTSGTLYGECGFTLHWQKFGKVVAVQFSNDTTVIPSGVITSILTLPSELRPRYTVAAECYRSFDNKCSFRVSPAGVLDVYTPLSDRYYISSCASWITA